MQQSATWLRGRVRKCDCRAFLAAALVALSWGLPTMAAAQGPPVGERRARVASRKGTAPAKQDAQDAEPAKSRAELRKIREGSLLRRRREKPLPSLDMRSHGERQRDAELSRHYTRMAKLDVIVELARRARDADLADRAEQVRRKEVRRFMTAMQRLLVETRQGLVAASPAEAGTFEATP